MESIHSSLAATRLLSPARSKLALLTLSAKRSRLVWTCLALVDNRAKSPATFCKRLQVGGQSLKLRDTIGGTG